MNINENTALCLTQVHRLATAMHIMQYKPCEGPVDGAVCPVLSNTAVDHLTRRS